MKTFSLMLFTVVLAFALMSCNKVEPDQAATTATVEPAKTASAPGASSTSTASAPSTAVAPKASSAAAKPADAPPAPAKAQTFEIPQGTAINIILTDAISSGKNKAGDTFTASLAEPIVVKGETIVAKGVTVNGRVIDAEGSGRVKGLASIQLGLTSFVSGGKTYPISTRVFAADADSTKKRDAGVVAGAGGVGAAIGAIAGGGKGAVKGAIIGGAAGTGAVLATKGKEVEYDSEAKLTFAFDKDTQLPKLR